MVDVTKDTMFRKGDVVIVFGVLNDIKQAFVTSISNDLFKDNEKYNEINLVNNYGSNALVEVYVDEVPEELEGVKIIDSKLKERYNITIGIIKRGDNYIYANKDTVIKKGDTLTLFGPYKNIKVLFKNDDKEQSKAE